MISNEKKNRIEFAHLILSDEKNQQNLKIALQRKFVVFGSDSLVLDREKDKFDHFRNHPQGVVSVVIIFEVFLQNAMHLSNLIQLNNATTVSTMN